MPQTEEEHLYGLELEEETESVEEGGTSHLNLVETNLDVCIEIQFLNFPFIFIY